VITSARCPSTSVRKVFTGPLAQFFAPAYRMFAPGAVAWTASTSSVCSPNQSLASHALTWLKPFVGSSENCDELSGLLGSLSAANVWASENSVGDW
jgi:hypothetical protein